MENTNQNIVRKDGDESPVNRTSTKMEFIDSIENEINELHEAIQDLGASASGIHGNNSQIEKLQQQIYDLEDEASELSEEDN